MTENRFSVDTQDRCLRNVNAGQVIPCSVRWIPDVFIMEEEPLADGKIVVIINTSKQYSRYTQCFSAEQAARLLEHRSWNHQISPQDPNTKIPTGAINKSTWEAEESLRKYLQRTICTGKDRHSGSATTATILFMQAQDGSLGLCITYSALNRLTIPNKYLLPLISKLIDKTRSGKWFRRLNLKNGYNLIKITEGDEWKTAIRTKQGLFEYTVMPFGLTNAPESFQEMIYTIFKDMEECI